VQDADDASGLSLPDERPGIVFRIARVNDDWTLHLTRERDLSGKREPLGWSRRIVIVIIESALPDRDR
jgi:hypothetical protein